MFAGQRGLENTVCMGCRNAAVSALIFAACNATTDDYLLITEVFSVWK